MYYNIFILSVGIHLLKVKIGTSVPEKHGKSDQS